MSTIAEVVTQERYKKGFTYAEYLVQAGEFQEEFRKVEKAFSLPAGDIEFYKKNTRKLRTLKALALVEDHSPDVWLALPILNQIAGLTGMEMRMFRRDQNLDIMDLYLNQGKFRSIPLFAFFDKDLRPMGHWIERPAGAHKLITAWRAEFEANKLSKEDSRAEMRRRRAPHIPEWCQEAAQELRALISEIAAKV